MRYCPPKRDVSTLMKGDFTTLRLHKKSFTIAKILYLPKFYTAIKCIQIVLLSTIRRVSS